MFYVSVAISVVAFLLLVVIAMYAGCKAWEAKREYDVQAERLQRTQARLDTLRRERLYTNIRGR